MEAALPAREPWAWTWFRVQPGEGRRVLILALLSALIQAGVGIGLTAADALFLTRVGVARLPVIYVLTPVVTALYIPVHTYVLHRLGVDRTLTLTLVGLAVGATAIFAGLTLAQGVAVTYYLAKLYAVLWYIVLYSLFWNYVDGFFDIQDAKRLYALLSGGGAAGAVVGGGAAAFLVQVRPVQELFLAWAALALLAVPVVHVIGKRYRRLESDWEEEPEDRGFVEQTRATFGAMAASPFVLTLSLVFLTGLFAVTLTEYQYLDILSSGRTQAELATLLGILLAVVSVFNLAVNLFLFNRLVLAIGVRNVALIQAGAYLVAFLLLLLQGGLAAAFFGYFTYYGVLASVEYNNQNFLFNAIPEQVRRQVRTVVEGLAEPMATALGGVFLFLAAPRMSPVQISFVGLGVALLYLGLVLLLRGQYRRSLVDDLKRRWLDLTRPARETLSGLSQENLESLRRRVGDPDPEAALAAIRILWLNHSGDALKAFMVFLRERSQEERRRARPLLRTVLDDPDPEVVRPLVEWMLDHLPELDPPFLEELGARGLLPDVDAARALSSPDAHEAAAAVLGTWWSRRPEGRREALDVLIGLLEAPDPEVRAAGVRALGHLRGDELAHHAARYLSDPDPQVRAAAFQAVRDAAGPGATELVESVLETLATGSERQAFVGLETLSRIGDPVAVPGILRRAEDFTPPVRRLAVRVLGRMGLKAVPASVAGLREPALGYRGRIVAARALARLSFAQLDSMVPGIVEAELARAAAVGVDAAALAGRPGAGPEVLRRFYADMRIGITDFILELLSLVGRVPDFEMLRLALRSGTAKERAAALEALEQGLGRGEFRRMEALLQDPEPRAGTPGSEEAPPPGGGPSAAAARDAVGRALQGPFPIAAAAGAVALWETDGDEARRWFARILPLGPAALVQETILHLLDADPAPSPVHVLHALGRAPFFESLPVEEVGLLAEAAARRTLEPGAVLLEGGRMPERLSLVLDGSVDLGGGETGGPGTLVGEGALLAEEPGPEAVVSLGCTTLEVSWAALGEAAGRRSEVALAVLRHRAGVELHAAP